MGVAVVGELEKGVGEGAAGELAVHVLAAVLGKGVGNLGDSKGRVSIWLEDMGW